MSGSGGSTEKRPVNRARIERIMDHNADTRSLYLRVVEGRLAPFVPGQFISLSIALPDETRTRPYTITSSPEAGEPFEICFNRVPGGRGVAYLFDRKVSDELAFIGPFGLFTIDKPPAAELAFIAEGTAIAPIRPMIRRALSSKSDHPIHLIYAAADSAHLLYRAELEELAASHSRFEFETIAADADSSGGDIYARLLDIADRRWVKGDADRTRHFYIAGVGPGVLKLRDLLRGAGYERRSVHYEQW